MLRFTCVMLTLALGACVQTAQTPEPTQAALARDGRDIAEAQCAACHSVGEYGESAMPNAPAFRSVLSRYRADVLLEEHMAKYEQKIAKEIEKARGKFGDAFNEEQFRATHPNVKRS